MSSITLNSVLPPQPATERNNTTHLSYDETTDSIAYPCGKSAFVRSLNSEDGSKSKVIQFVGHGSSNVTVVKFSPIKNSQFLASGDDSGKVIVWGWSLNDDTKAVETTIKSEFQVLAGPVTDLSWDFEGRRLCVVGEGRDKFGVFISWDTGNSLGEVSGHSQRINACHLKQSRPMRAVTVGDDGAVCFYQGPPFKFAASDRIHHDQGKFIRDVQFSPNSGEFIVSVGSDRKMACFDGKTGEFIKHIEDSNEKIEGGLFALSWLDETKYATASADATIRVWDVTESKCIQKWTLPNAKDIGNQQVGIVATKDNRIISLSLDGTLNCFQLGEENVIKTIQGHNKGITALSVNPLLTGSYDGKIMEWETRKIHGEHTNLVVSIDANDSQEYSSVSWDDTLRVNGEIKMKFSEQPKTASLNGDGFTAVLGSDDTLFIINSFSGEVLHSMKLKEPATAVGLGRSHVAVGYEQSKNIEVFKLTDLSVSYILATPLRATPSCISFSPSEKYLAAGEVMGKILLFDLETKEVKTSRWAFHSGKINAISWLTVDGEEEDYVATGSLDTHLYVYSVKRPMRNIKYLNAHKDGVTAVQWKNSTTLVSTGTDACIKEWAVDFQ